MAKRPKRNEAAIERVSKSLDLFRAIDFMETALHEAAHIVVCVKLGRTVESVALGKPGLGGGCTYMRLQSRDYLTLRDHMIMIAAGPEFDGLMPAAGSGEKGEDQNRLVDLAREICGKIASQKRIDAEIRRARRRAAKLVRMHRGKIEELAGALVQVYRIIESLNTDCKISPGKCNEIESGRA